MIITKISQGNSYIFDIDGKYIIKDLKIGNDTYIDEIRGFNPLVTGWKGTNVLFFHYSEDYYLGYYRDYNGYDKTDYIYDAFLIQIFDYSSPEQWVDSIEQLLHRNNWYYFNVLIKESKEQIFAISFALGKYLLQMINNKISKLIFDIPRYHFDEYPVNRFGKRLSFYGDDEHPSLSSYSFDNSWSVRVDLIEEEPVFVIKNRNIVAETDKGKWLVLNKQVINDKHYDYISGFDQGLAIVYKHTKTIIHTDPFTKETTTKKKEGGWGIIDIDGYEALPLSPYIKEIWSFYGKGLTGTTFISDKGESFWFDFESFDYFPSYEMIPAHKYLSNVLKEKLYSEWKGELEEERTQKAYGKSYVEKNDDWWAMTDGQYGDEPDDFNGDYSFLGY